MKLILTGGREREGLQSEATQYDMGIILTFDTVSGEAENNVHYESPPETCPVKNPSILFKAGSIRDSTLYVCTQTEVLMYSLPSFVQTGYVSLKCFNDLHHVACTDAGHLLIANTGLDMVIEMTQGGTIIREWDVLGEQTWNKFSKEKDYRLIPSTKPHKSHPNYVFTVGPHIWVTRCHQQDAVCLTNEGWRIPINGAFIHDGVIYGEKIYFTRVDGYVVKVNLKDPGRQQLYNLNKMAAAHMPLGWCRGIKPIGENKVIVCFSRLRPTIKINADGSKTASGNFGVKPTHIACFDLLAERMEWEFPMEKHGLNAIYSIH